MTNSYDVVIVGGGVMGCSIQHNLADRGMNRSLLVEKMSLGQVLLPDLKLYCGCITLTLRRLSWHGKV